MVWRVVLGGAKRVAMVPSDPVEALPHELCVKIFSELDGGELGQARRVSRQWKALADDECVWRGAYARRWGKCASILKERQLRAGTWRELYAERQAVYNGVFTHAQQRDGMTAAERGAFLLETAAGARGAAGGSIGAHQLVCLALEEYETLVKDGDVDSVRVYIARAAAAGALVPGELSEAFFARVYDQGQALGACDKALGDLALAWYEACKAGRDVASREQLLALARAHLGQLEAEGAAVSVHARLARLALHEFEVLDMQDAEPGDMLARLEQAAAHYTAMSKQEADSPALWRQIGLVQFDIAQLVDDPETAASNLTRARSAFERALDISAADLASTEALLNVLFAMHETIPDADVLDEANRLVNSLQDLGVPSTTLHRARLLSAQGNYQQAKELLEYGLSKNLIHESSLDDPLFDNLV